MIYVLIGVTNKVREDYYLKHGRMLVSGDVIAVETDDSDPLFRKLIYKYVKETGDGVRIPFNLSYVDLSNYKIESADEIDVIEVKSIFTPFYQLKVKRENILKLIMNKEIFNSYVERFLNEIKVIEING